MTGVQTCALPICHAGSSLACAGVLYRKLPRKQGAWILLLAVLISLSRLYVGVHYPTDVLAGAITGIGCSFVGEWVVMAIGSKMEKGAVTPNE